MSLRTSRTSGPGRALRCAGALGLFLALAAAPALRVQAADGQGAAGHDAAGHEGATGQDGAAHSGEEHDGALPGDLTGTWNALLAERQAIEEAVAKGALGDVHPRAERMGKLALNLEPQSGSLPADKRTRVAGAAKQLVKLADSLHDAADGGDAPAVKRDLGRLASLLKLIESQYPPGTLPASGIEPTSDAAPKHAWDDRAQSGALPQVAAAAQTHEHLIAETAAHDPIEHDAAAHDHAAHEHAGHDHSMRPAGMVNDSPQAELAVNALGMRFQPTVLRVTAGVPTRISLRNGDGLEHALVVKTPDGKSDWVHLHAPAGSGDAGTYKLDAPGSYPIACTIPGHQEAGMIAELVVEAAKN